MKSLDTYHQSNWELFTILNHTILKFKLKIIFMWVFSSLTLI